MGVYDSYPARGTPATTDIILVEQVGSGGALTKTTVAAVVAAGGGGGGGGGFSPAPIVGLAAPAPPAISIFTSLANSTNTTAVMLAQPTGGPAQFSLPLQGNGAGLAYAAEPVGSGAFDVKCLIELTPFLSNANPQPFAGLVFVGETNVAVLGFTGNSNTENELALRAYDAATLTTTSTYQNIGMTTRTVWLRGVYAGSVGGSNDLYLYFSTNGITWLLIDSLASSYFGSSISAAGIGLDTFSYYAEWVNVGATSINLDLWHWSIS